MTENTKKLSSRDFENVTKEHVMMAAAVLSKIGVPDKNESVTTFVHVPGFTREFPPKWLISAASIFF